MKPQGSSVKRLFTLVVLLPALAIIAWTGRNRLAAQERLSSAERERLLATIRDSELRETDPERVIAAIQRLGVMHDIAAIDDLIPLLTFKRLYPEDKDPSLPLDANDTRSSARRFPAIEALVLIGRPALPALVHVIGASDPESLDSKCALEAVRWIFSRIIEAEPQNPDSSVRRWRAAAKYLTQAASEASSPGAGDRLRLGAEKLRDRENYKPPH